MKADTSKYEIEEMIASGGMAEIYRVVLKGSRGFKKQFVMKRLRAEYSQNKEFIESLVHEAHVCVLLNHENIVQVHDLRSDGERYFILMEYIDGLDLNTILNYLNNKNDRIPENLALLILKQICQGLEYAHNKTDENGNPLEIVHRDISPHNIIISQTGTVKITDFGIAKAATKTTKTLFGTLKGKLLYMSPEQMNCAEIDHRSDIFSLGTLAYEILTGKKLFDAENEIQIIDKVRRCEIPAISQSPLPSEIKDYNGRAKLDQKAGLIKV